MSKKIIIINIVIWALIAVLVVGAFVFINFGNFGNYNRDISDLQIVKEKTISNNISNLEIEWINGDVNINLIDGNEIKIVQKAKKDIREKYIFSEEHIGSQLNIKHRKDRFVFNFNPYSVLEINIPKKQYQQITVSIVNGNITSSNLEANRINLESVSGNVLLTEVKCPKIKTETVSGTVYIGGEFEDVETETVSGAIDIYSKTMINNLNVDTISGLINISIPENDGFKLKFDKISGSMEHDFDLVSNNEEYIYKKGIANFDIEVVSGKLRLNKII